MDRKKLIYLGLLLAAGGAFMVDRLFLGEPEPATAEMIRGPGAARRTPRPTRPSKTDSQEGSDPSLTWLDHLEERQADRDVFSPSTGMLTYYSLLKRAEEEKDQQAGPKPGSPQAFENGHQLQGTFVSEGVMLAVVNGRVLCLGDTIDGFRLIRIEPYRAEFRRGRHRASLQIPVPALPE